MKKCNINFFQMNHLKQKCSTSNARVAGPRLAVKEFQQRRLSDIRTRLPKVNNFIQEEYVKEKKGFGTTKRSKSVKYGFIVMGLSVVAFLGYDSAIEFVLDYNFQLRPGGLTTQAWQRNPIPINSCWRLFGIANGQAFLRGQKPFMVEHGPFCYDVYRVRTILEWRADSVKFTERIEFVFNPKISEPLDTPITMVNLPMLAGVMGAKGVMENFYVSFLGPIVYNSVTMLLRATGEQLIEQVTARQMMEGRKLKIVEYIDLLMRPFRSIGIPLPDFKAGFMGISDHGFGIASSAGMFELGPYEAYTKTENAHTVGWLYKYDGQSAYTMFKAPCSRLGGSDGIFHPKPLPKYLYIYIHHLCRVLRFDRNASIYYGGAQVERYTMDPHMFNMRLKRNRCFCVNDQPWQECDGWNSMGPCFFGVPIGISFPHFFNSPRRLREVNGLNPDADKHFGHMYMEPQLGLPVSARLTFQAVLAVTPISSVSALSQLPSVKYPILWVEMFAGADTPLLKSALFVGSNSLRYGSYMMLLGGIGLSGMFFLRELSKRNQQHNSQN